MPSRLRSGGSSMISSWRRSTPVTWKHSAPRLGCGRLRWRRRPTYTEAVGASGLTAAGWTASSRALIEVGLEPEIRDFAQARQAVRGLFPTRKQHYPAHDHGGAENDPYGHAFHVAQKYRRQD